MEPAGYLDQCISDQELGKRHNSFSCDHPDEDVHFSRVLPAAGTEWLPPTAAGDTRSAHYISQTTTHYQPLSLDSYHLSDYANFYTTCRHQQQASSAAAHSEQAKSNKLLQYIGARLRRGSSYLEAPKLVGQYLLGITIQSWSEFLNTSRLVKPPSNRHLLARRLISNLAHFQGNYLCVALVLVIYCILTSPLLLLAIIAYLAALYVVTARSATGRPLRILRFWPNLQQQYSFITLLALPLLWVAGAPSAFFWVIGASFVVVGFHASLYSNPKEQAQLVCAAPSELRAHFGHRVLSSATGSQHPAAAAPEVASLHHRESTPTPVADTNNNNSYASVLTHWISFGNTHSQAHLRDLKQQAKHEGGAYQQLPAASAAPAHLQQAHQEAARVPEVTIISQDFAGLGRVYEI